MDLIVNVLGEGRHHTHSPASESPVAWTVIDRLKFRQHQADHLYQETRPGSACLLEIVFLALAEKLPGVVLRCGLDSPFTGHDLEGEEQLIP